MKRMNMEYNNLWRCPRCGNEVGANVRYSAAWCAQRHTGVKMELVRGELSPLAKPPVVRSKPTVAKATAVDSLTALLKEIANGR